jgi:eukaryotic-like serine/threonine-protein kinase
MELIGQRFGHIRVTDVVGQGGMGEVYAGYDEKLERKVAVKVLNADQRLDADARKRLLREARALSLLDHPNICRIFDYLEHEDVDLLVLEYIDGPTLDQASANLSRGEKLRIASAIAGVLVAAHRAGIVHRDLKPENVMLTSTGEVKVLDFGLARLLRHAREVGGSADRHRNVVPMLHVRSSSDTLMLPTEFDTAAPNGTAVGVTLGTPLYMSPEQARGETLTPASDMYSFGLLLQMLFTGAEPHPQGLPPREIILRVARGETNPVTGVERDVASLLARLKQMVPADRPAAVEALASIEHMRERSQRIVKWTTAVIAAMVLLFIGWRYTADLKHERAKAIAAQAEAEKRRAQAEDLINFMVGDLRTKLNGVGQIDILDDVSKKTLKYVSDVDPTRMTADELARFAKVLHQLGEVQLVRGDTAAALPLFRHSLDLSKAAIVREPRNPAAQLAYATSHCWIGEVHRQRREYPLALESMRVYMNVTEKLARKYPGNADYQYEWTSALNNVGIILEAQGDVRTALEHYKVSLAARSEAVRRKPDDLKLLADLAAVLNKVGVANHKLGALPVARDYFRRELETYRTLVAADPKQSQWRHRMAVSLGYLALMHWYMGDVDGAQALWREELSIDRELADRDPKNIPWQRNPALTTRRLANVSEMRGELQQSQAMLQEARARLEALQKQKPSEANVAAAINAVDLDLGRVLAANGSRARARTVLENVIARVETSSDRASQITLARAVNTLGETFRESDPPRAEAAWRRAEQLLEPLVLSTNDVLERDLWCRVLVHRGRCADARRELGQLRLARYDTRAVDKVLGLEGCK